MKRNSSDTEFLRELPGGARQRMKCRELALEQPGELLSSLGRSLTVMRGGYVCIRRVHAFWHELEWYRALQASLNFI